MYKMHGVFTMPKERAILDKMEKIELLAMENGGKLCENDKKLYENYWKQWRILKGLEV